MEQQTSKNTVSIFNRHPKITICAFIFLMVVFFDFIAAQIFIPPDYNYYRKPNSWYHHGFQPGVSSLSSWGKKIYQIHTNSLGFIDKSAREVALASQRHRVLIIGDSFTEGRGIFYTETFPGLIEAALEPKGIEIFNAAVSSYCPKLYYLKVKYLLEQVKFRFNELVVFIDISDIPDEILYEKFEPAEIPARVMFLYNVRKYFERNSATYFSLTHLVKKSKPGMEYDENIFPQLRESYKHVFTPQYEREREYWTLDREIYERVGKKGLALAEKNMDMLYRMCQQYNIRLSIAVYPWPFQIAYHDVNSLQEQFWRIFCEQRKLNFIDLFPLFINKEDPKEIYMRYYINGDIHWNMEGHKLVARKVLESL